MKPSKKSSPREKADRLREMKAKLVQLSKSEADKVAEQEAALQDFSTSSMDMSIDGIDFGISSIDFGSPNVDLDAVPEDGQTLDKQVKEFEDDVSKSLFQHVNASRAAHDHELELDFYFAIYFASAEERDTFLEHSGFGEAGDTIINGRELGKKLGFKLPEKSLRLHLKGPKKNVNLNLIREHRKEH